jgi:hypothetical protein
VRTNVHANSRAAYFEAAGMISRRAQMVLDWVRANGRATDRQVMQGLGFTDGNAVKPRISELIQIGLLVEVGATRCHITGKTVRLVDVPRGPAQGRLFS